MLIFLIFISGVVSQEYSIFGIDKDFYQVGKIFLCSNITECYDNYQELMTNQQVYYGCFNKISVECSNDTINDNNFYISFCITWSADGNNHTIFSVYDGSFVDNIQYQCNNLNKYNLSIFCVF